jgi:hypothetical protein
LLLQAEARGVVNGAELDDGDQDLFCHGFARITWIKNKILTTEDTGAQRNCIDPSRKVRPQDDNAFSPPWIYPRSSV